MLQRCKTCKYYKKPKGSFSVQMNNIIYASKPRGYCNTKSNWNYISEWKALNCIYYDHKNLYYKFMYRVRGFFESVFKRPIVSQYSLKITHDLMEDINDTPLYHQFLIELFIVIGIL